MKCWHHVSSVPFIGTTRNEIENIKKGMENKINKEERGVVIYVSSIVLTWKVYL